MAEIKSSSIKSLKKSKQVLSNQKLKSSSHHIKNNNTENQQDCKTPPLPTNTSLEQLLKQREDLKTELQKITIQSKSELQDCNNLKDSNNQNIKKSSYGTKRSIIEDKATHNTKKNRKTTEETQDSELDSEDEENIIEQRRIQRKQLLEKLSLIIKERPVSKKDCIDNGPKSANLENSNEDHTQITQNNTDTDIESSDMFSEKDFVTNKDTNIAQDGSNTQPTENFDDAEGYYNITVGDTLNKNQYTIKKLLGQGVFANVVLALDNTKKSEVAIKIMRNNDLIYKTGIKELALLKEIREADIESKHHCVKFLSNFVHKGHLCVVLEPLYMDMRKIIKKYGKHHGLNMKAVISYSRQLFIALRLLKKIGIIHADVKPDNILVNEKKNILKLCDFGSASKAGQNEITPYLVSRFYRAPEIILGIPYKHSIDIWSAACTIYELATGRILFTGSSNNKMLKCFMDLKGKVSSKIIRKSKFKDQHFNYNNSFLLHKKDEISGREKFVELCNITPTRDLSSELKKYHKSTMVDVNNKLSELKDLLENMLIIDSNQRFSVSDCLRHEFVQDSLNK